MLSLGELEVTNAQTTAARTVGNLDKTVRLRSLRMKGNKILNCLKMSLLSKKSLTIFVRGKSCIKQTLMML